MKTENWISKTSGESYISGILKATTTGLRQQYHLSPSDIKARFVSNILINCDLMYNTETERQILYGFNKY